MTITESMYDVEDFIDDDDDDDDHDYDTTEDVILVQED